MGTTVLLIPRGTSEAELSSFFAAKGFHPSASKNYKAKNVPKTRRIMAARMREFVEINLRNNEVIASKEQVVATKAFTKAADLLSLSDEEACQIIGVKESEILKMKEKSQCLETKSKPFELAILVIRLFKQVDAMFGGDIKVMVQWLRSFNTAIGDVPAVKIASITGLYDVVAYLEGRHGAI